MVEFCKSFVKILCFLTVTRQLFSLPPNKQKHYARPVISTNDVLSVKFAEQVKCRCVLLHASLGDYSNIHRPVKSRCCAENWLRGTFSQCSTLLQ